MWYTSVCFYTGYGDIWFTCVLWGGGGGEGERKREIEEWTENKYTFAVNKYIFKFAPTST